MIQIKDETTLRKFIQEVDSLHDALLHEAVLMHPGYVDLNGQMFADSELPNAKLFFQSQFADIALVELSLRGVSKFHLEFEYEWQLEGEMDGDDILLYFCGKQRSAQCGLRSKAAAYRLLGRDCLGPEYRLVKSEDS